jgi:hypothetical protein
MICRISFIANGNIRNNMTEVIIGTNSSYYTWGIKK